ncbi:MAG: hypothetical protein Q9222_005718 [Ikaeria aurantiellina]
MPAYRNITINLVSQFDILNIPEYAPPATPNDPFTAPHALSDTALVSCYVPTYPLSQFWFSYSISAPHPPKALYYFKLFINGACAVSWGCGEDNDFKGRTMYGLYDSGERWQGETGVAVRAFGFASDTTQHSLSDAHRQVMEVKVYRARGRKRIRPELEEFHALVARSNKANQENQPVSSKNKPRNMKGGIRYVMLEEARVCSKQVCFRRTTLSGITPTPYSIHSINPSLRSSGTTVHGVGLSHSRVDSALIPKLAQLETLGVTRPLSSRLGESYQLVDQTGGNHSKPVSEPESHTSTPEASTGYNSSPGSASDISPLVIRGLSLPSLPFIDLPPPPNTLVSALKRTGSPIPISASSSGSTPRRFAQLIRSSSRSPSPAKLDLENRPPSGSSLRRTASMGALMGAVRGAMRRSGKGSSESARGSEESECAKPHEKLPDEKYWPLKDQAHR